MGKIEHLSKCGLQYYFKKQPCKYPSHPSIQEDDVLEVNLSYTEKP